MILSDSVIRNRMATPLNGGGLRIVPWEEELLSPNSYDVRLGDTVLVYRDQQRPVGEQEPLVVDLTKSDFELRPGDFALADTRETVTVGNGLTARIAGKSSRAREGLSIEYAGWVDSGFSGTITLELVAHRPFVLHRKDKIGQIVFMDSYPCERTYDQTGHYQGQSGPTPSWTVKER